MKSILRIVYRYVTSAFVIALSLLFLNILVFGYCIVTAKDSEYVSVQKIAEDLSLENGSVVLSQEATTMVDTYFSFGILLDSNGNIIWERSCPEELNHVYTLQEIAVSSKWYLNDYPVYMWNCDQGLLILGKSKGSIWKFPVEYPQMAIDNALIALPLCNLILLSVFCIFFGWRFYHSLKPVAEGIESLSLQKKTSLKERGILADLKKQINQTSEILEQQTTLLAKRDDARTQWIAGVSHDIRTPLSMIMGYADTISKEENLTPEQVEKLEIIRNQSILIKDLVDDLNMTSKLEYQMQPLKMQSISLSSWLRGVVSDYCNENPCDRYQFDLAIDQDAEKTMVTMDRKLLDRAMRNLLGNSIRHNPEGCDISLKASVQQEQCVIIYHDTGKGLPAEVLQAFRTKSDENAPHILGLYLVEKIIIAHHGTFSIDDTTGKGMSATIVLPKE